MEKYILDIFEPLRDYKKENQNELSKTEISQLEFYLKTKEKKIGKYKYSILKNSFGIGKKSTKKMKDLSIIYKFNCNKSDKKIRIFGEKFVLFNKHNCILFIKAKQKKLKEFINCNDLNNFGEIKIRLKFLNIIKTFSSMFDNCSLVGYFIIVNY